MFETVATILFIWGGALLGGFLWEAAAERADARRQVREWDATVQRTTGMAWNPHTQHYERPATTVPYTPPRRRTPWWDYLPDVVLVTLWLYAAFRLRNRKGGKHRG